MHVDSATWCSDVTTEPHSSSCESGHQKGQCKQNQWHGVRWKFLAMLLHPDLSSYPSRDRSIHPSRETFIVVGKQFCVEDREGRSKKKKQYLQPVEWLCCVALTTSPRPSAPALLRQWTVSPEAAIGLKRQISMSVGRHQKRMHAKAKVTPYLFQEDRNGIDHHSRRTRKCFHHIGESTGCMIHLCAWREDGLNAASAVMDSTYICIHIQSQEYLQYQNYVPSVTMQSVIESQNI